LLEKEGIKGFFEGAFPQIAMQELKGMISTIYG
jgi:hypothetical protein